MSQTTIKLVLKETRNCSLMVDQVFQDRTSEKLCADVDFIN